MQTIESKLALLSADTLRHLNRGVEKESLRVQPGGLLSTKPHPRSLGSALTHPQITTDFSEAQLELVTGVHTSIEQVLTELSAVHALVHKEIDEERLWAASMPCYLPEDDAIPIAQFGSSNVGMSKTVYRNGLAHRYGRRMQTISGVHYNFSLPDNAWAELSPTQSGPPNEHAFRNQVYFGLIRNFRRYSWLLLYLFGASPAVCGSFVAGREHRLEPIGAGSMYLPYGTSMRMGPLGYQSDAQKSLAVSYNCLEVYAESLQKALTEPYGPYTEIGIRDGNEYRQLCDTLLQIENEFYGLIRPKRPIKPGERPLHALNDRGVEYVEVRCLDLDPFSPVGLSAQTSRFIDVFLMYCMLTDSPNDTDESIAQNNANQLAVAERGRAPGLSLHSPDGKPALLVDMGQHLVQAMRPIAMALDSANATGEYSSALEHGQACLQDATLTPSSRILSAMARDWGNSYSKFALNQSEQHRSFHLSHAPSETQLAEHRAKVEQSWLDQQSIEAADETDFETYRQQYISQAFTVASG